MRTTLSARAEIVTCALHSAQNDIATDPNPRCQNVHVASKRQIFVGGVPIGGGAPVVVQTMTKTETANLDATMEQIHKVAEAGADLVRCAVPRDEDAVALKTIVKQSPIPI